MFRLFNTLTRSVEEIAPRTPGRLGVYSCGPTVYRYVHIGNLRTYLMADWLKRSLAESGFEVEHVVNITDVGHMRSDLLDRGEDKMIASALREGRSPAEIAQFYSEAFFADIERLGIVPAGRYPRATDHVPEMIVIIEALVAKGHAYNVDGTIYFDVASLPGYGALSGNTGEDLLEGVRGDTDPNKRDPRDFALWKAAEPGRLVSWPSPWGAGFPGWHIECSAMATKYLGTDIDIHTGGVDNIFPHHEDEIAQCEGAFGHPFVRHWVHAQHLLVDGLKMAKSTGNAYTLQDVENRGFEPAAFRYLCLGTHYRHRLNFTFTALRAAQRALERLRNHVRAATPAAPTDAFAGRWRDEFRTALEDDLAMPRALAVTWAMLRDGAEPSERVGLLLEFDRVLGLDLAAAVDSAPLPEPVGSALGTRADARAAKQYAAADDLRQAIEARGFSVRDAADRTVAFPIPEALRAGSDGMITSSNEVSDESKAPPMVEFSFLLLGQNNAEDLERAVASIRRHAGSGRAEIVVVDNGSTDGTEAAAARLERGDPPLRVIRADHNLGTAGARNASLRAARGEVVVLMDTSVELDGDVLGPLRNALADASVGAVGPFALHSHDLRHFDETSPGEADAIQAYLFAFKRERLAQVGLMDEKFRFYRNLDLDFSLAFRAKDLRLLCVPLPVIRHEHREWAALADDERERRSKKNFYRFHHRWGSRTDLLQHTTHDG